MCAYLGERGSSHAEREDTKVYSICAYIISQGMEELGLERDRDVISLRG